MNSSQNMRFLAGPMEGVMRKEFIRACNELELFAEWVTPFYRFSDTLPRSRYLEEFLRPFMESNTLVTVQIMGTNPQTLAAGAKIFCDLGVSGIDLNCGCPSRQVTSGGAGGGALRNIDNVLQILETVKSKIGDIPLSIKTRTGYQNPHEQELFLPRFAALGVLNQITMHFRTVTEQYKSVEGREERWQTCRELVPDMALILNGDITTLEELNTLPVNHNAQGAMVARGILRDPFLLRRVRNLSAPDLAEGQKLFFATVLNHAENGFSIGQAIELSNFIWGKANPYFERLKSHKGLVTPTFLDHP